MKNVADVTECPVRDYIFSEIARCAATDPTMLAAMRVRAAERRGRTLLRRAKIARGARADAIALANGLIRPGVVQFVEPEIVCGTGLYMVRDGQPCILIAKTHGRAAREFIIAHEIAEWAIGSTTYDNENDCNLLAAELLVPGCLKSLAPELRGML